MESIIFFACKSRISEKIKPISSLWSSNEDSVHKLNHEAAFTSDLLPLVKLTHSTL